MPTTASYSSDGTDNGMDTMATCTIQLARMNIGATSVTCTKSKTTELLWIDHTDHIEVINGIDSIRAHHIT